MVFVADDLAAWLSFILAEAGRKKLTSLVLGTDQERALRSAATAAVQGSAAELRSDNAEQANQLARSSVGRWRRRWRSRRRFFRCCRRASPSSGGC